MRFSLRQLFFFIALVAIATRFWMYYGTTRATYVVIAHLEVVDWNPHAWPDWGRDGLLQRFQFPDDKDDFLNSAHGGISAIGPSVGGGKYQEHATYWNYEEQIRGIRRQMNSFVVRQPDLEIGKAEIRVLRWDTLVAKKSIEKATVIELMFDPYSPRAIAKQ